MSVVHRSCQPEQSAQALKRAGLGQKSRVLGDSGGNEGHVRRTGGETEGGFRRNRRWPQEQGVHRLPPYGIGFHHRHGISRLSQEKDLACKAHMQQPEHANAFSIGIDQFQTIMLSPAHRPSGEEWFGRGAGDKGRLFMCYRGLPIIKKRCISGW